MSIFVIYNKKLILIASDPDEIVEETSMLYNTIDSPYIKCCIIDYLIYLRYRSDVIINLI